MGQTASRLLRGGRTSTTDDAGSYSRRIDADGGGSASERTGCGLEKGKGRASPSMVSDAATSSNWRQERRFSRSLRGTGSEAAASARAGGVDELGHPTARPRPFSRGSRKFSKSSDRSGSPAGRAKSSKSIATIASTAGSDRSSTPTSPSKERTSLSDKLKSRRRSSFVGSEQSMLSQPHGDCGPAASSHCIKTPIDPSIDETVQSSLEPPYVHAALPITPPEESDAILEERQRIRQLIESAGVSLSRPQLESAPGTALEISSNARLTENEALSGSTPSRQSPIEQVAGNDISLAADATPSATQLVEARGADSSIAVQTALPEQDPAVSGLPSVGQTARAPGLGLPRRILVQGIVSRSLRASPSQPSAASAPHSPVTSTAPLPAVVGAAELDSSLATTTAPLSVRGPSPPGDSGFWNDLVEDALSPSETVTRSATDGSGSTGNSTWDEAVAELLALPDESALNSAQEAQAEEDTSSGLGEPQPGSLIGRLLGIAAASTAATLLPPGSIVINGQRVAGFDDAEDSAAIAVGSSGAARTMPPSRGASSPVSEASPSRLSSYVPAHPGGSQRRRGSGSLQTMLQDALASAVRSPASSPAASPSLQEQPSRPIFSPDISTNEAPELLSSQLPVTNTSPVATPYSTPPLSGQATSRVPTLAIPIPEWSAEDSLAHGRAQPEGTFERFLADLQTE